MNIGKISQDSINENIQNMKRSMSEQDIEDCNIGLSNSDQNGDGYTSGIEIYKSFSKICSNLFSENEELQAHGEELSLQIGEIYSRYAGEDGMLDAYEYNAALQSDEMSVLLNEYWEMKDFAEASKGENAIGLLHHDINNDDKTSAVEIYQDKIDLYSKVFEDDEKKQKEAEEIALTQSEILSKYAGSDGVLNQEEYSRALRSEAYGKTMTQYLELKKILSNIEIKNDN